MEVKANDFDALAICALRYCVGRRTYMPSLVIEIVKRNWQSLKETDKNIIRKDLGQVFESEIDLGHDCDIREWNDFFEWVKVNCQTSEESRN